MSSSASQTELKRVEDLWFPDATLILRAENSLFRVHSGILAARSSVFRDMIAFPQPAPPTESEENETIDGHVVVRLHDLAGEVEVFLRAIFDSSFFMPPPSPVKFQVVIGVMRLAHKYDVQYLFKRALSHLDSMFPVQFMNVLDRHSIYANEDDHVDFQHGDITVDFTAFRAALEVEASWILPTAYYNIARESDFLTKLGATCLSAQEEKLFLAAQTKFLRAVVSAYRFVKLLPSPECDSSQCEETISNARDGLERWNDNCTDTDPLGPWVFDYVSGSLCDGCELLAHLNYRAAQEVFWDRLPTLFGLPTWNELKELRRKVMEETVTA
ncbi:BTB domain-containing protein [Favolaschia claudopus]|uniref:BTB domain-containing protein n=1 Tax=Favolaschia claudopus TaxID=2862362 RepID=A0AAV9ZS97_9AGAR